MQRKEGRGSQLSAEEVLREADRLAGAKGPKRTRGGYGAYNPVELIAAIRSLKGKGGSRQEKSLVEPPSEPVAKGGSLDAFAGNTE